MQSKKM